MSLYDHVLRASGSRGRADDAAAIRRKHGSGASRWVADQCGISIRQAQRRLAGHTSEGGGGRGPGLGDLAEDDWHAAEALASAQGLDCGHVTVTYNGRSQGTRRVGFLDVDGAVQAQLNAAAAALLNGDHEQAEQIMSDAILGAYADQNARDGRTLTAGTLKVSGFRTGFHIV